MNRRVQLLLTTLTVALSLAGLAACSSGSSKAASSTASGTSAPTPTASAAAGRGGGRFDSPAVRACLKNAGITLPTGTRRSFPSGSRPSGSFPSGGRPSGSFPSGARPSGGGGLFGNSAQAKKIQIALKACGITLPSGGNRSRPSGSAGATPSASPTS